MRHQEAVTLKDRAAKAGCYFCLTNRGGLVNTEMEIYGEGWLFVCDKHVGEMAKIIGYISPSRARSLKDENIDLRDKVKGLETTLADRDQLINALVQDLERRVAQ